ncbi:Chromosome transmission fidelity protein 18 [Zancudomyces culisetae]|uniref:Chromosome transmission fidelity protein 18 n=1 Tax=Zancudomyces culisetae TaxID=1213189 RepID=A0A1R1PQJ8_ZANCU|nr:Chromosome transmission fidelity protein 18 [Zancudomyces culisetae]|eukprot:OMH83234.1 Chromosome transmission fidelity protein 18 [Zancudomyces culisetae]
MESSKNAIYTKVPSQPQKAKVMGQLWVDKYKPKTFFDLVGNEKINRMVLSWVKHWDYCVFNRDNPAHLQMDYYRPGRTGFSSKKGGMGFSKSNDMRGDEANQPIDTLKRPFKKILLLSGPPGVGKTTLAHIVARQAGYKPVEINASDDRTAAKAKNMILSATGIKKNHQSSKKGSEDIDRLDQNQGKRQQKKASNAGLLRPIICICNDLYTPALLPLREVAQSIQIYPPPELATTKYLSWVCLNENLKLDNWTISKLVKRSRGDLRSCLNSLQFISVGGSNQKELLLGDKDHHASLFSAWEAIFTIQNSQSQQYDNSTNTRDAKSHLIKLLESNGEFDKLMQGMCYS